MIESPSAKALRVSPSPERFFLSEIEVQRADAQAVVAVGDSITDGYGSTPNQNHRWPDYLAERLAKEHRPIAVINAGISGNRMLHDILEAQFGPSALSRLDRDVISVADLIAGMQQIVARAHAHGMRVIGGTLTPFAGAAYPGYYGAEAEAKRQALNRWIRDAGRFDAALRDPNRPGQLMAAFDCGDHLHPNDAGYEKMAEMVKLDTLAGPKP